MELVKNRLATTRFNRKTLTTTPNLVAMIVVICLYYPGPHFATGMCAACCTQEDNTRQAGKQSDLEESEDEKAADDAVANADPDQIRNWISELDANDFDRRDKASGKLITAGVSVIPIVVEMLPRGSAEAKLRGIYVLRTLALSDSEEIQSAANTALEDLRQSESRSIATKADAAARYVAQSREMITLARLEKLGAQVDLAAVMRNGQFVHIPYVIRFGEDWTGTDDDLRRLKWLVSIREIEFHGEKFTDESIKQLKHLPEASDVTLNRCSISNEGLKILPDLKNLSRISIHYCAVTDACIQHLQKIKYASLFKLYGTKMSRDAALTLSDEHDGVEVDFRKGGLLGVACLAGSDRCLISAIEPESAAEKAGIRIGDVIYEFAGRPVSNIGELTAVVANFEPGKEAIVKWRRGDEELQASIELGSW